MLVLRFLSTQSWKAMSHDLFILDLWGEIAKWIKTRRMLINDILGGHMCAIRSLLSVVQDYY